jgi:Ni,Fe-hydrogenase I large subunit
MLARLLELARLPAWLRQPENAVWRAWALPDQTGVAGVETSRGLLLHLVRLANGKIDQYRIIAPTEWNFHPAGPLAEALADLPADARLDTRARQVALSLDPCVEYGINLEDA